MADTTSSAAGFVLTDEEKRVYGQIYRTVDADNLGVVTGEAAVKFFEKTKLDSRILGEIWQIADKQNRGLLTPAEFGIVLRLVAWYQAGRDPTADLALTPGPLPKLDGVPQQSYTSTTAPLQPQISGSQPIRVPPLAPERVAQYSQLFDRSGQQNGILSGDQAKVIFERAGLPNEVLGKVWGLADTESRGAFNMSEFVVAMHLLASVKSGQMRALPNVLPPGLMDAARRPIPRPVPGVAPPQASAIPRQLTGQGRQRVASPLSASSYAPPQPIPAQLTGQLTGQPDNWLIQPRDKQTFDQIYATLDTTNKGYITGDEAVPFLSNSKLPEDTLASIWDLADINSEGRLNRDEFAIAMYLIRQQRAMKDGRDALPTTLPANLIPPSMRMQDRSAQQHPTAPAFEQAPSPTMPKSAADDLFGLDALSSPTQPALQPQSAMNTGRSESVSEASGNRPANALSPTPTGTSTPASSSTFKPFVPSSNFGQTLGQQHTGQSTSRALQPQTTGMSSLLEEEDTDTSKNLTNESAELANLSSQVDSLSKQMQDVQVQKSTSQNQLSTASSQKQQFESRLAQLRNLYEEEVKEVSSLRQQLTASINDTQRLKGEITELETSHQEISTQRSQLSSQLEADQKENAALKERINSINAEITELKPQLEKLRSDARQQKGMVAINKKQLATIEADHTTHKAEHEELTRSAEEHSHAVAEGSNFASAQVASPVPSSMSASNPFFKRQGSESATSPFRSVSPVAQQGANRSFDDIFGTSFDETPAAHTTIPPTTFMSEAYGSHSTPTAAHDTALPITSPVGNAATVFADEIHAEHNIPEAAQVIALPTNEHGVSRVATPLSNGSFNTAGSGAVDSRSSSSHNSRQVDPAPTAATQTVFDTNSVPSHSPSVSPPHANEVRDFESAPRAQNDSLAKVDSLPGAFPTDTIEATPTGSSLQSDHAFTGARSGPVDPFDFDNSNSKGVAPKSDFDSAFAGFTKPVERSFTGASANNASASKTNQEFPPLQQMDDDEDDSDSASEGGFDDDFAGSHSRDASTAFGATHPEAHTHNTTVSAQTSEPAGLRANMEPPSENAQASPPTYGAVTSPHERAHVEATSFSNLLPTRETPIESSISHNSQASQQYTIGQPMSFATGPAIGVTSLAPTGGSMAGGPAPPAKVSHDDFDDEFDDLEDAQEGGEDDIVTHDRSMVDEFDSNFDSPAHSKASTTGNAFNSSYYATQPGTDSSPLRATSPTTKTTTENHDWDAIFSGLSSSSTAPVTTTSVQPSTAYSSFPDDEITFAPPPGPPPGRAAAVSPPAPAPASSTAQRPNVGRALTEAGVHDDPILKELTDMGYARKDALSALEKYDYNLERAANHLANQS